RLHDSTLQGTYFLLLQWSRRSLATETHGPQRHGRRTYQSFNGAVARWRRRPTGSRSRCSRQHSLQWSRRSLATETLDRHPLRALAPGLASMEPSLVGDGDAHEQRAHRRPLQDHASMEPSLVGDGDLGLRIERSDTGGALQWSRRSLATETRRRGER